MKISQQNFRSTDFTDACLDMLIHPSVTASGKLKPHQASTGGMHETGETGRQDADALFAASFSSSSLQSSNQSFEDGNRAL